MSDQERVPPQVIAALGAAVLAISSAAILVRLIEHAPPVTVAFWRMVGSAVVLAPALRRVSGADARRTALAGLFLAAHFASWFTSLQHTTVLRSTVLVCSSPVWVGALEWAVFGRRPTARYALGVVAALAGVGLMGAGGGLDGGSLLGDGLGALGGLCAALYFVIGRSVRQRVGVGTYMSMACGAAALALAPTAFATGAALWPLTPWDAAGIAALVAGPQLIGHNGFSYALRHVPASTVSAVTLLEPVGAAVLAALVLREVPGPVEAFGALLVAAGVGAALRDKPVRR